MYNRELLKCIDFTEVQMSRERICLPEMENLQRECEILALKMPRGCHPDLLKQK